MDPRIAKRLILPATLVVTTFISASSCKNYQEYCVDIENMSDCDTAEGCGWNEQFNTCANICHEVQTQADCEALERCEWSEGYGTEGDSGTDTGGGESCHEPFT